MPDDVDDLMQAWTKAVHACSFCGATGADGSIIFCSSKAAICADCVAIIHTKIVATYPDRATPPTRH